MRKKRKQKHYSASWICIQHIVHISFDDFQLHHVLYILH